jgi:hypothetical protein
MTYERAREARFRCRAAARPQESMDHGQRVYDILGGRIAKLTSIISLLGSRRVVSLAQRVLYLIDVLRIHAHGIAQGTTYAGTFGLLGISHGRQ